MVLFGILSFLTFSPYYHHLNTIDVSNMLCRPSPSPSWSLSSMWSGIFVPFGHCCSSSLRHIVSNQSISSVWMNKWVNEKKKTEILRGIILSKVTLVVKPQAWGHKGEQGLITAHLSWQNRLVGKVMTSCDDIWRFLVSLSESSHAPPGLLQYPREFTCTQFLLKVWVTACYPCLRCFEGCSVARCHCWTQRPQWPALPPMTSLTSLSQALTVWPQ